MTPFRDQIAPALKGKNTDHQLHLLAQYIAAAEPLGIDITEARRLWIQIHEDWAASRLPSTRKELA